MRKTERCIILEYGGSDLANILSKKYNDKLSSVKQGELSRIYEDVNDDGDHRLRLYFSKNSINRHRLTSGGDIREDVSTMAVKYIDLPVDNICFKENDNTYSLFIVVKT